MGREGGNWWGLEPGDNALTTWDKTHASQWYLQAAENLCCSSWCFKLIFKDRKSFLLQKKSAMSASVEIIFFWAWLVILIWENEPKLKETTVNYFEFRHQQSTRVYTWYQWISKSRRQNHMDFSYIFSWSFQVWLLATSFFPNVSTSSV